jgi:hypothetical protein
LGQNRQAIGARLERVQKPALTGTIPVNLDSCIGNWLPLKLHDDAWAL